ncbi:MAG: hypothetical protein KF708_05495 [Pirellulales bacterium]|nr:hypothetical protein [Pirellulales bacterium]
MSQPPAEQPSSNLPAGWLESPWLWFGLFAAMGIFALLVVAPKYARRQGRLEQRYENRLRIEEQRRAAARDDGNTPSTEAPTRMGDARASSSLAPIALVLLVGFSGAAFFVWWRARRPAPWHPADGP